MTDDESQGRPGRWDGCAIAAIALLVYTFCGRSGFHGIDVHFLMWRAHLGAWTHEYHTFYLPAIAAMRAVVEPLGGTLYTSALLVSAVGAAVSVLCAHAASRMIGLDRRDAAFAALLCATLPATAFYASIVEVHALALAFAGFAWLAIAHHARQSSPGRAVIVGIALIGAYLAHPSAAPLGGAMAAVLFVTRPRDAWRPLLRDGAIALVILVVGIALLPVALRSLGAGTDAGFALDYLGSRGSRLGVPERIGRALWNEWLIGLLPTGLVLVALAARGSLRVAARAAILATLPFVAVGWLMLEDVETEYGAYTMALAWPTALVVTRGCRSNWLRGALVIAALGGALFVHSTCTELPRTAATAAAVRTTTGDRPFFWLLSDRHDFEAWLVHHGHAPALSLSDLLLGDASTTAAVLPILEADIARRSAAGESTIVTSNALAFLADLGPRNPVALPLLRWLEQRIPAAPTDPAIVTCHRLDTPR